MLTAVAICVNVGRPLERGARGERIVQSLQADKQCSSVWNSRRCCHQPLPVSNCCLCMMLSCCNCAHCVQLQWRLHYVKQKKHKNLGAQNDNKLWQFVK